MMEEEERYWMMSLLLLISAAAAAARATVRLAHDNTMTETVVLALHDSSSLISTHSHPHIHELI